MQTQATSSISAAVRRRTGVLTWDPNSWQAVRPAGTRIRTVKLREDVVVLVDPNEAAKYQMPIGEFQRYWSSYALVPVANDGGGSLTEVALCVLGAVIIAYALFRLVRRTGARLECANDV